MKSIRLNQGMRADILDNIMNAWKVSNPEPEVKDPGFDTQMNKAVYAKLKRDHSKFFDLAKDEKVHKYLTIATYFQYRNELNAWVYVYSSNLGKEEGEQLVLPYCDGAVVNLNDPFQITPAFQKIIDAKKKWRKEVYKPHLDEHRKWSVAHDNYSVQIHQVLSGVNTTKQLLEAWPEVEKFLPEGLNNPSKIQLPSVVNITQLNEELK